MSKIRRGDASTQLGNAGSVVAIIGALVIVSSALAAQGTPTIPTQKSPSVTTLNEGEAIMIGHKGQRLFNKEAGKLYLLPGNDQAAQTFQSDFDFGY